MISNAQYLSTMGVLSTAQYLSTMGELSTVQYLSTVGLGSNAQYLSTVGLGSNAQYLLYDFQCAVAIEFFPMRSIYRGRGFQCAVSTV